MTSFARSSADLFSPSLDTKGSKQNSIKLNLKCDWLTEPCDATQPTLIIRHFISRLKEQLIFMINHRIS